MSFSLFKISFFSLFGFYLFISMSIPTLEVFTALAY